MASKKTPPRTVAVKKVSKSKPSPKKTSAIPKKASKK